MKRQIEDFMRGAMCKRSKFLQELCRLALVALERGER